MCGYSHFLIWGRAELSVEACVLFGLKQSFKRNFKYNFKRNVKLNIKLPG